MTERVEAASRVLINALLENTLRKGNCNSCAVGHLVVDAMGGNNVLLGNYLVDAIDERGAILDLEWHSTMVFFTQPTTRRMKTPSYVQKGLDEMQQTAFSFPEIIEIEKIFENKTNLLVGSYSMEEGLKPITIRQDMRKGVKGVIEYLLELDNCTETVEEVFTLIHKQLKNDKESRQSN